MGRVAVADDWLGRLHHCRVPEDLHLTEVVTGSEELVAVSVGVGGAVAVVDVRAVHALGPDSCGGPGHRTGRRVPLRVSQASAPGLVLRTLGNIVVEKLVGAIISPKVPRVR